MSRPSKRLRSLAVASTGVAVIAAVLLAIAHSSVGGRAGTSSPPPQSVTAVLQTMALSDLQILNKQLGFKPYMSPALPVNHFYDRITWVPSSSAVTEFGVFISSSDNPSAGHDAIHFDEWLTTPAFTASPRNPMRAFAAVIKPVRLSNGTWYEMQQQHPPDQGKWILMAQFGNVFIQMDGLDTKAQLEQFAGSLGVS
jgi:hypothetical protein